MNSHLYCFSNLPNRDRWDDFIELICYYIMNMLEESIDDRYLNPFVQKILRALMYLALFAVIATFLVFLIYIPASIFIDLYTELKDIIVILLALTFPVLFIWIFWLLTIVGASLSYFLRVRGMKKIYARLLISIIYPIILYFLFYARL